MGTMSVMNHTGDSKIMWNADNEDEVASARRTFDDLTKKGYLAYTVDPKDGSKGEAVKRFDPDAQKLVLTPALRGG